MRRFKIDPPARREQSRDFPHQLRISGVPAKAVNDMLFFIGALFCQSYFDRKTSTEARIRALARRSLAGLGGTTLR